ncbi:alpha/beta hydrolase [Lactobacillus delbrueckii]|uniref:alpha/beta hydrolase n=1 Tax=Lactobacillus delbrueckii TaxID=1584 RepID=UPI0039918814
MEKKQEKTEKQKKQKKEKNKMSKKQKGLLALAGILAALLLAFGLYFGNYYHADKTAQQAMKSSRTVKVKQTAEGYLFDGPAKKNAIIFYPGAKVETTAYAPLLKQIASQEADVFLVDMPLHMAFFGLNKADKIRASYHYQNWYMSGHSLGAAMAARYSADHLKDYRGLIMLAGYPTKDLHAANFSVLSIYGSKDGNAKMLQKNPQYLPKDYTKQVIKGGNHAQFGNYGRQKGDGQAAISRKAQQQATAQAVRQYLLAHNK